MYHLATQLDHADRRLFERPIEDIMKLNPSAIERWVKIMDTFLKAGLVRAKKRLAITNRSITSYIEIRTTIPPRIIRPVITLRRYKQKRVFKAKPPKIKPPRITRQKPRNRTSLISVTT